MRRFLKKIKWEHIFIFVIILQLLVLIWFNQRHFFNSAMFESDSAAEILFSEHLFNTGGFGISSSWFYSTEVRILHNHLVMTPLFYLTNNYATVHTISSAILTVMLSMSVYYVLRTVKLSRAYSLLGVILMALPYGIGQNYSVFSINIANNYYTFFVINTFLFLSFYIKYRTQEQKKTLYFGLMVFLSVLMGLCGIRYLMILFAPFFVYELYQLIQLNHKNPKLTLQQGNAELKKQLVWVLFAVAWLVGYMIYRRIVKSLGSNSFEDKLYGNAGDIRDQITLLPSMIVQTFGFFSRSGRMLSVLGLINMMSLVYFVFVVICIVLLWKRREQLDPQKKIFVMASIFIFLINTGLLIILKPQYASEGYRRYLWLGMNGLILFPVLFLHEFFNRVYDRILSILIIVAMVFLSYGRMYIVTRSPEHYLVKSFSDNALQSEYILATTQDRMGYMEFLEKEGYEFGWATFWNASITTVLSSGNVRMANIWDDWEELQFRPWLMPKDYVNIEEYPPEFILYTKGQVDYRSRNGFPLAGELIYQDDLFFVYDVRDIDFDIPIGVPTQQH